MKEIVDLVEQNKKFDELSKKLNDAKKIANEISSMTINVYDSRRKFGNIEEYVEDMKNNFFEEYGYYPDEINLTAVSHSRFEGQNTVVSQLLYRK